MSRRTKICEPRHGATANGELYNLVDGKGVLTMIQRQQWTMIRRLRMQAAEHATVLSAAAGLLGVFLAFEIYFLRELLAAELLFGLGFALLSILAATFYLIGVVFQRGFDRTQACARLLMGSLGRMFECFEMMASKAFGHQHLGPASGSARDRNRVAGIA